MDRVRTYVLELSDAELEALDGVVEHVVEESKKYDLELDPARARSLLVSSLVAQYLEQHRAIVERDTKPEKDR
jgi:hypothetical protein